MEYVTIKMTREAYDSVMDYLPPHEIKLIKVEDDLLKSDPTYNLLKKASHKAYKKLQEYEFTKRNQIT